MFVISEVPVSAANIPPTVLRSAPLTRAGAERLVGHRQASSRPWATRRTSPAARAGAGL